MDNNVIILRNYIEFIKAQLVYNSPLSISCHSYFYMHNKKSSEDYLEEFLKFYPPSDVLYYKNFWYKFPTMRKAIVFGRAWDALYKNLHVAYLNNIDNCWYSFFSKSPEDLTFHFQYKITISDQKDKIKEFNIVL